jgi:hypothetical protein
VAPKAVEAVARPQSPSTGVFSSSSISTTTPSKERIGPSTLSRDEPQTPKSKSVFTEVRPSPQSASRIVAVAPKPSPSKPISAEELAEFDFSVEAHSKAASSAQLKHSNQAANTDTTATSTSNTKPSIPLRKEGALPAAQKEKAQTGGAQAAASVPSASSTASGPRAAPASSAVPGQRPIMEFAVSATKELATDAAAKQALIYPRNAPDSKPGGADAIRLSASARKPQADEEENDDDVLIRPVREWSKPKGAEQSKAAEPAADNPKVEHGSISLGSLTLVRNPAKGDVVWLKRAQYQFMLCRCLDVSGTKITVVPYDAVWPQSASDPASFPVPAADFRIETTECFALVPPIYAHVCQSATDSTLDAEWAEVLSAVRDHASRAQLDRWNVFLEVTACPGAAAVVPCALCRKRSPRDVHVCRRFFACAQAVCDDCLSKTTVFGRGGASPGSTSQLLKGPLWSRIDLEGHDSQWMCTICCESLLGEGLGAGAEVAPTRKRGRHPKDSSVVPATSKKPLTADPRSSRQSPPLTLPVMLPLSTDLFIADVLLQQSLAELSAEEALNLIRVRLEEDKDKARLDAQNVLAKFV